MSDLTPKENNFILYTTPEGAVKLSVLLQGETIWLTQRAMSVLFDTTPQNITIHLKNIFESDELEDDMLDKAWGLEPDSRLGCQALVGDEDLVVEIPKYTVNMVSENH